MKRHVRLVSRPRSAQTTTSPIGGIIEIFTLIGTILAALEAFFAGKVSTNT